jgi:glycosyltransferase involved in cell wall biosynthesis
MGAPVVSVNQGGIRDSLEGCPAGFLVDGGATEMASRIIGILQDRSLREKMSAAGPKWVAGRFDRDRMVEDYYSFFASLINS